MESNSVFILNKQYRDYAVRLEVIGVYSSYDVAKAVAMGLCASPERWDMLYTIQEWQVEG